MASSPGMSGKTAKSLRIFPGEVDKARLTSLFAMVKGATHIGIPSWDGGLAFSSKQESVEKKDFWDDGPSSQKSRMPCTSFLPI